VSKAPSKKRPSSATGLKWFISASATVATLIGWQAFAAQEPVSIVAQQPQPQSIQVPAVQPSPSNHERYRKRHRVLAFSSDPKQKRLLFVRLRVVDQHP
jgi:hypothetical protein